MYLGIDLGTSSLKVILIDEEETVNAETSVPLAVSRPQPLWSEQDPEGWWIALKKGIEFLKKETSLGVSGILHRSDIMKRVEAGWSMSSLKLL